MFRHMASRKDCSTNLNSIYPHTIGLPNGLDAFIPEHKCNMISLAQLSQDSKCFVTFSDTMCAI